MKTISETFSESTRITTIIRVLTKALGNTYLFPVQEGAKKDRFVDEKFWEALSMITIGSL
jgi:hypothetical protein